MSERIAPDTATYTIPELVEILDAAPGRIHRLIEEHALAAVRIDGVLRVPREFIQGNQPLPPLRGTLLALMDAGYSSDESVAWLLAHNDEIGERPIDSLNAGRKSAVRRATQSLAF
ncbi:Rv2175c family DNA-binding protein [Leucobacter rhizosphaerae]|uniref:Rv2175c family DNA-binding protein n=1 Tax=Leucobacter rhizosphaerae TaxID=2932245 RepID=A0ABY4FXT5_9MICO|nr:Rv2175c family DNA-binding protein [Leucobacter rhizosphaerae]UOQ61115.1 Rv2175c family DNA-binding protein [Leucobacter rhizosphaerae]